MDNDKTQLLDGTISDAWDGLKATLDFYNEEVAEDDIPRKLTLNPRVVVGGLLGVSELVVKMVTDALQEEMDKISAANPEEAHGFYGFFDAANKICEHIDDYPIKGDTDTIRDAVVIMALSMAATYYGYIQGHGDALVAMEPKNRKERRHGVVVPKKDIVTP